MGQIFPLRFVPMDPAQYPGLYLACYRNAWQGAHGSLAGFNETACRLAVLDRARKHPGSVLEVRGADGEFAGFLAMDDRRDKKAGWIVFLYVPEELRGRGIGRAMLEESASRYTAMGRRVLRLTVAPGNSALAFYEKLGFCRIGSEPGALEDLYVMEKEL